MILQLAYILYCSLIGLSWGIPIVYFSKKSKRFPQLFSAEDIILSFLCGISIISLLAVWISLFCPLYAIILPTLSLIPIIYDLWLIKHKCIYLKAQSFWPNKRNTVLFFFLIICLLLFLILSSNQPIMEDMDLYHLQIIRWNKEFGTVPGVANLYLRYGFYSNWLYCIAFFSFPLGDQNFLFLNVTLSFWGILFLIYKISYHNSGTDKSKIQNIFDVLYFLVLSFMLLEWKLFRGNSSSTSYDFVVSLTIFIVLSYILEDILLNSYSSKYNSGILVLLAVSASFYKISGSPIIIILATYLLLRRTSFKVFFAFCLVLLMFLMPFFIKNYIQSGYLIFPYKYFAFLKPDWQVPSAMMEKHYFYISIYNKYLNQQVPWSLWISPPDNKWIPGWLNRQTFFDYWLIILNVISLPVSFFMFKKIFGTGKTTNHIILIYTLCLAVLAIWFFSSPDPRFAYGFLLITGFLIPSLVIGPYLKSKQLNICFIVYLIIALIYAGSKISYKNILTPASIKTPAYETVFINKALYYLPKKIESNWNSRCYYTDLPCIYEINPYLEQRGNSLKNGFRMSPIKDSSFILNYRY